MAAWLFHFALVAYAVAAVRHLATVVRDRKESAAWADRAIALGFVLHGASVALRMVEIVRGGPFHFSVGLSLLAFLTVGVYLLAGRGLPLLGACVAPLVVGILLPAHAIPEITASTPTWLGWARPVHIGVALAGLALFGLGFLVSIFYLLLQRELKARRPGTMFRRLPSLAQLDAFTQRVVAWGFVLLSLTILTGALFPSEAGQFGLRMLTKEGMGVLAWALTAGILLLRQTLGWRGKRVAFATMMGFLCLAVAFVGVFIGRPT